MMTEVWMENTILGMKMCILMGWNMIVGLITQLVQGMRGS
jgi:hypothetical protein